MDLDCPGEALETRANVDLTATKASLKRMAGQYLHGANPRTPPASPLHADLSGLPPLLIVVGGDEVLLDDSVRLARAAGIAGVDVTLNIGAGMQHIFPIYCGVMPEADAAVAMIGGVDARPHEGWMILSGSRYGISAAIYRNFDEARKSLRVRDGWLSRRERMVTSPRDYPLYRPR